jgi:hypothetical protein
MHKVWGVLKQEPKKKFSFAPEDRNRNSFLNAVTSTNLDNQKG